MTLSSLDTLLWVAGVIGNAALLAVLVWRRRWREYPVFAALAAYQIVIFVALNLVQVYGSKRAYFLAYWLTAYGDYVFQVALIVDVARVLLHGTGSWIRAAWRSFLLWGALGTALAAGLAFTIGQSGARGLDLWEVHLTVFTALLTCELFLVMSMSANRLGVPWTSHVMAIGQGLTIWAAIALVGDLGHVLLGWDRKFAFLEYTKEFAYLGVLIFWAVALWLPEKERAPLSPEMEDYLLALHRRVQYDLGRTGSVNKPL